MPITVNEGGTLYELKTVTANEGGTLYELNTVHSNEDGTLYEIFSAYQLPTSLSWSVSCPPYPSQVDPNGKVNNTSNDGLTVQYLANMTGDAYSGSDIYCSIWSSDMRLKAGTIIVVSATEIINANSGSISDGAIVAKLMQHYDGHSSGYTMCSNQNAIANHDLVFSITEDGVYNLALSGYASTSSGRTLAKITAQISFS
ncbi:MAG: hypothetical protein IJZ47_08030 [Oscillospiraceae bacterium]|nr:hypothetical protein [Oscillospiraceae bacterium]